MCHPRFKWFGWRNPVEALWKSLAAWLGTKITKCFRPWVILQWAVIHREGPTTCVINTKWKKHAIMDSSFRFSTVWTFPFFTHLQCHGGSGAAFGQKPDKKPKRCMLETPCWGSLQTPPGAWDKTWRYHWFPHFLTLVIHHPTMRLRFMQEIRRTNPDEISTWIGFTLFFGYCQKTFGPFSGVLTLKPRHTVFKVFQSQHVQHEETWMEPHWTTPEYGASILPHYDQQNVYVA